MARRRLNRRHLVVAGLLVALAVLPNVVHLRHGLVYRPPREFGTLAVNVLVLDHVVYHFEPSSLDRAQGIAYRWEQFRRCWWILAAAAGCIVVWALLPIPPILGPDDDEPCD